MSYFLEIPNSQTYSGKDADFHFSYNANSGGGQSFLGGKYRNEEGQLTSPSILDGYTGMFEFKYMDVNGNEKFVLLKDEKGMYEIKPRGEGSTSMKLAIGTKMKTPSKLFSTLFMLPTTCGVKCPDNLNNSILTSNNYWLQSMWLECKSVNDNDKTVHLIPIDFVFCGGRNKENQGQERYFKFEASKRVNDILKIAENSDVLPNEIAQCIRLFADIYLGKSSFEYEKCYDLITQLMHLLAKNYPEKYSGIEDPIPFVKRILNDNKSYRDAKSLKSTSYLPYITAIKTKPFLLLAGISGTGKSQKVQELAFMTCPKGELREENSTTPGNYCLIEVKPNWHDSTELLGYYSALSGKYELTDFIRFAYKALMNPTVPFFLCLDEMNLAPVEQYFAEYLSVLETRKKTENGIKTQPLLPKERFSQCGLQEHVLTKEKGDITNGDKNFYMKELYSEDDRVIIEYLKENGLHLPDNLFVIGTVNMDDTTHQFSRKVIDRAFTIEMNGGKMVDMFSDESRGLLEYRDEPLPLDVFRSEFVRAYEVLEEERFSKYAEDVKEKVPTLLGDSDGAASEDSINGILNKTPFRVSYRVQNELILYLSVLIENAGFPENIDGLISEATLAILLEKVLPRIQGEQKQLETRGGKSNILKDLNTFVKQHFAPSESEEDGLYTKVVNKLDEMDKKLEGYYTNFF